MTDQTPDSPEVAKAKAALRADAVRQAAAAKNTAREIDLDGDKAPTKEQLAALRKIVREDNARKKRERDEADAARRRQFDERVERARAAEIKMKADRAQARSEGADPGTGFTMPPDDDQDIGGDGERFILWPEYSERRGRNDPRPLKSSTANVRKAIEELGLTCSHDYFLDVYTVEGKALGDLSGELTDPVQRRFCQASFEQLGFEPGRDAAWAGLYTACENNRFNSLQRQLDPLVWDGEPRLGDPDIDAPGWLTTYLGVKDNELHRAWGRLWLMAAVRRVYDPGCKFDHIPVFEAPEGTDKSSFLKVLACGQADQRSEYFSESPMLHLDEKKQQEATQGVWIYELAEMAGHRQGDDLLIKSFVTREAERARPAYARSKVRQWRVTLFAGTFNPDENGDVIQYLNIGDFRRWWPMTVADVHPIDLAALQRDRWQLLAEAKQAVMWIDELGSLEFASMHLPKRFWAAGKVEQRARQKTDPYSDILSPIYKRAVLWHQGNPTGIRDGYRVTDTEVSVAARKVLEMLPPAAATIEGGRRVPRAMRALGWHSYTSSGVSWYKHERDGSENDPEGPDTTGGESSAAEDFAYDTEPVEP